MTKTKTRREKITERIFVLMWLPFLLIFAYSSCFGPERAPRPQPPPPKLSDGDECKKQCGISLLRNPSNDSERRCWTQCVLATRGQQ